MQARKTYLRLTAVFLMLFVMAAMVVTGSATITARAAIVNSQTLIEDSGGGSPSDGGYIGSDEVGNIPQMAPGSMDAMESAAKQWYRTIVTAVVFPLTIVSVAWSGMEILGAGVFSAKAGQRQIDKAKQRALFSLGFFIAILLFPLLMQEMRELVQSSAWDPTGL